LRGNFILQFLDVENYAESDGEEFTLLQLHIKF
jgi:hypothetical protein